MSDEDSRVQLSASGTPEHNWEKYYNLKAGDVFVEAGAFWGRYGKIAALKVGLTGSVILVEPDPYNIDIIKAVVKKMNLNNVILVEKAVWDEPHEMEFITYGNPAAHRLVDISGTNPEYSTVKVQSDTLDNILSRLGVEKVDLLACDVEGAEISMVKGAERYFNEKRILNVALGAYHAPGNPEKITEILTLKSFKNLRYEEGVIYGRL